MKVLVYIFLNKECILFQNQYFLKNEKIKFCYTINTKVTSDIGA